MPPLVTAVPPTSSSGGAGLLPFAFTDFACFPLQFIEGVSGMDASSTSESGLSGATSTAHWAGVTGTAFAADKVGKDIKPPMDVVEPLVIRTGPGGDTMMVDPAGVAPDSGSCTDEVEAVVLWFKSESSVGSIAKEET